MKKEEIYVVINSEEKRLRAIQILNDAGEEIFKNSNLLTHCTDELLVFDIEDNHWRLSNILYLNRVNITLDQLEQMLNPNFVVKDIALPLEELQKQAELLGFDLVKKERQIKAGDFGKFWDNDINEFTLCFLKSIDKKAKYHYQSVFGGVWSNFAHLTEEEKARIQENW
jgi:hypothetical protein